MDSRLAAWERQVKARQARIQQIRTQRAKMQQAKMQRAGTQQAGVRPARPGIPGRAMPALWLFTDLLRLPDPVPAILRMPRGCGVVFRHDAALDRAALAARVARACLARGVALAVAGDPRLAAALGAGVHLRGGRWARPCPPGWLRPGQPVTSSAHGRADLRRAARAGAGAVFLSPLFPTLSHPGAAALGPVRWSALAQGAGCAGCTVLALGGVSGATVRRVPRDAGGAGLIGGWAPYGRPRRPGPAPCIRQEPQPL